MANKIIDRIIKTQLEEEMITYEDVNVYRYGYTLIYEMLVNVFIALLIGFMSGDIAEVFTFLLLYIPLRSFCGGWHADKLWKCTIYSNIILVVLVLVDKWLVKHCDMWIMIFVILICMYVVFVLAPLDTKAKPIEENERKVYKTKINIINLFHIMLLILFVFLNIKEVVVVLGFTYIMQAILLMLEFIKKYKEKTNI